MAIVRCSACRGRQTLGMAPTEYIRLPACKRCGRKMDNTGCRGAPHFVVDRYRMRVERGRKAPKCDPAKTGCRGYSFIHRRGSGYCDHNPRLTVDMLQEREACGRWA